VKGSLKAPRGLVRLAGAGVLAIGAAVSAADSGAAARGVELTAAVQAALTSSPELGIAAQEIRLQEGNLLVARADFDLLLETSATGSRLNVRDAQGARSVQKDFSVALRGQRLLRNGLFISPQVSLTHSVLSSIPSEDTNRASVAVTASMPLLRDRWGAASAAAERAAERDVQSSRFGRRHVAAERVLAVVAAYWDYLAASRALEVAQSSEDRARRTADETAVLVQADERTPADLTQVRGNLAAKKVSRIAAEQSALEARAQLGLAMGLPADAALGLPPPATDFPGLGKRIRREDAAQLVEDAYRRRADLAAVEADTRSAALRLDGARNDLRPRLDLGVTAGYNATEVGLGASGFFSPLYRDQPRLDAVVELTFQFPVANSAARGRVLQTSSAYEQRRFVGSDLRRRIAVGVAVALEAVARGEAAMTEAGEAVRLFEAAVQAVQRKFQLGVSTLFDLIQAQDALTGAQLSYVQSQRDYAVAIATLRFQSGRLVEGGDDALMVPLAGLLAPP
jgi:outer membrane protein